MTEIVIDIDTFEIFTGVDNSEYRVETGDNNQVSQSKWDNLDRVWIDGRFYYKPGCLIWEVKEEGTIHQLFSQKKDRSYGYYIRGSDWGRLHQLSPDEALWKTLEFAPELIDFV